MIGLSVYEELLSNCMGNSICVIECFKQYVEQGGEYSEEDVKKVSSLLGEPTRKIEVFNDKYLHVFMKNIQRNCIETGDGELCIYSWAPGRYVRYFPASLDATGTILYFKGDDIRTIAYPVSRTYDIEGHKVVLPDPSENPVVEVTKRIDGYQITFYYNPLLKKWIPATRYVMHNMMYVKRRLVVESLEEIINPYVSIAYSIAEEHGLYDKLRGYEGWTFTFILEAPEPAILRPNIELFDPSSFKLYLLVARKPSGELLTVSESRNIIDWPSVDVEDVEIRDRAELEKYIEVWRTDLSVRSRFIRFLTNDRYRPYVVEVSSKLYGEAVAVKYMSNPKSLIILASHGYGEEAVNLLVDYRDIRSVGKEIIDLYLEIKRLLPSIVESDEVYDLLRKHGVEKQLRGEVEKVRRGGDVERLIRKLAAILVGEDIYGARDRLKSFLKDLRERLSIE